jgi:alkylation response protein AidB-like acyl-CoA dehydrogenase
MDFDDTPEEAAFRAEARAWLAANAPRKAIAREGIEVDAAQLSAARDWQAKKAAAGYAQITWPKEWGGRGGTPIQQVIFDEEQQKYSLPPDPFIIGLGMCLPAVMTLADEATKNRFMGPALRGEEIWCQLFSEPSGGSDVAAVRTRAVRANDGSGDWIIDGQKVWTSGAQYSAFGVIICRTDPDVPKHKGMTMFWVDMKSPGIEIRPIHQMAGGYGFNEVFFTGVRVKDSQRLGAVDEGFRASMVVLMHERVAGGAATGGVSWGKFLEFARNTTGLDGAPLLQDQSVREKLADWYVTSEGLKHTRSRAVTALSRGQTPGPENSISKALLGPVSQDLANSLLELLDQYGVISDPGLAPQDAGMQRRVLGAPAARIAGGTDEILKNIIAERVLGLPGDIRVDKDTPFKDLPVGR